VDTERNGNPCPRYFRRVWKVYGFGWCTERAVKQWEYIPFEKL
jgi:hypothetical protein